MFFIIMILGLFVPPILAFFFALYAGKTAKNRIFYFMFWLFFFGVLLIPNNYLAFWWLGDSCNEVEGRKYCSMPVGQVMLGSTLSMVESLVLLFIYHKLPENTAKQWLKKAVFAGFCILVLIILAKMLMRKFDIGWD